MSIAESSLYDFPESLEALENLSWYVIHTCSQQEAKVENGLRLKNLELFLPRVRVRSRRRDRVRMLDAPLFPGYLFVRTSLNESDYLHIIKHNGVVRILGTKDQYVPVPDYTVASIRSLVDSAQPIFPWTRLESGKRVRVIDGPLAGVTGVIVRLKQGKTHLVINVELLGRSVYTEISEAGVEVIR